VAWGALLSLNVAAPHQFMRTVGVRLQKFHLVRPAGE
jgi:hypothetical protein